MKNRWESDLFSLIKMENIQKQMVIPGNLPSQLCVLDSSQQLYASLFLASSPSSANTLFSKLSEKPPSEKLLRPSTSLSLFGSPLWSLPQPHFLLPYHAVTSNDLPKAKPSAPLQCCHLQRSLQQPPFLHHYNVVTSLLAAATFPSLSSAPLNGLRDPLPESSSTCQSLIVASKSEVDSLWPLRMWHVAR